jgi:hypothetical protein
VAGHVAAHPDFGAGRRLQKEMRVETRDGLEPEQREPETFRQPAELAFGQVTVSPLNRPELIENR